MQSVADFVGKCLSYEQYAFTWNELKAEVPKTDVALRHEILQLSKPYIAKWKDHAPWTTNEQVEQDLIISRALVALFSDEYLRENLAFRGGTALHKLNQNRHQQLRSSAGSLHQQL